jgi:hypothetical protein
VSADRGLWIGVAAGGPLLAWGVIDALGDAGRTKPAELVRWIVGAALVVDLIIVPVGLAAGRVISGRAPLRWALAATATLVVVGWPFARGYGSNPTNPSLLPRNYGAGITVAVAVVWAVAALWWVWSARIKGVPILQRPRDRQPR